MGSGLDIFVQKKTTTCIDILMAILLPPLSIFLAARYVSTVSGAFLMTI
jgi:uncharacterized membrane protein YqaE (UPF0057 family)